MRGIQILMAQITFDHTISLGSLLHIATTIGALIGLYVKLISRLTALEGKMDIMYGWFKKHVVERGE